MITRNWLLISLSRVILVILEENCLLPEILETDIRSLGLCKDFI